MKIWQCYDNLPAQAWYYTNDNRIAVTGKGWYLAINFKLYHSNSQIQVNAWISLTVFWSIRTKYKPGLAPITT